MRAVNYKRLTLIAVICFAVVSCLGCYRIVGTAMVSNGELQAGESFVDGWKTNTWFLILPLCAAQMGLLSSQKRWTRILAVVIALLACLITVVISPNSDMRLIMLGGLIGYRSEAALPGYAAIFLSLLILGLQIILLIKREKPIAE